MSTEHDELSYGIDKDLEMRIMDAVDAKDYKELELIFDPVHPADIAQYLSISPSEHRNEIIESVFCNLNPDVISYLDRTMRDIVIEKIGPEATSDILHKVDVSDAVYIIENLPEENQDDILSRLPDKLSLSIRESLAYPENSLGRIMRRSMVTAMDYWTVGQTIDYLSNNKSLPDDFLEILIVNKKHIPLGGIMVSKLFKYSKNTPLNKIADTEIQKLNVNTDQEEASYIFKQYGITSAAVTNHTGKLIGIIYLDDMISIIEQAANEDIMLLSGVGGESDIHESVTRTAMGRMPWLIINLITALVTSFVINYYGHIIQKVVILAAIMPIVTSIGGNAGTQTLTVAVRSLATKEVTSKNSYRFAMKQTGASIINGIVIAFFGGLVIYLTQGELDLSMIFCLSIVANMSISGLLGSSIPMFLSKMKIDPAIASSVFLTTITDVIGSFATLILAKIFLLG